MTVTFAPEMTTVIGYRLADVTGGRGETVYATYDEATQALLDHRDSGSRLPGCTDPEFMETCGDEYIDLLTEDFFLDGLSPEEEYGVNVSNVNARALLDLLGLAQRTPDPESPEEIDPGFVSDQECDLYGSEDGAAFLGRVLTALALTPPDAGVPWTESRGDGGGTMVSCGRRVGYFQDVLGNLHVLAQWCADNDRKVQWN